MRTKQCSNQKCKHILPLEEFYRNRSTKDGLQSQCKKCNSQYYQENRDRLLRRMKEYYVDNQETLLQYQKKYQKENREKISPRAKGYYRKNREEELRRKKKKYNTINGYLRVVFNNINQRCGNPKTHNYSRYGGRGIKCLFESVDRFIEYIMDGLGITNIEQIKGLEIDRINNNGHYEKGNIRFVTAKENCSNRGGG